MPPRRGCSQTLVELSLVSVTEIVSKAWQLRHRLLRFAGVSVIGVMVTQVLLFVFSGPLSWDAVASNVAATMLAAVPVYLLNRRWVWGKRGPHSVAREIVPFWSYTLLGLGVSTAMVAAADRIWGSVAAVMLANLAAWGLLWLGKFVLLERYLFRGDDEVAPGRTAAV